MDNGRYDPDIIPMLSTEHWRFGQADSAALICKKGMRVDNTLSG